MALIAMKCPGCGADIEMDDSREFGFCTYCGTKVMQDKLVVEHKRNVKIDNSEFVQKYLQNAQRAKQKEDWEETEKYYNLVEQNDPTNIEAIFYSSYGKAKMSLIENDIFKREQCFKVLNNCVSIIDDNYSPEKAEEEEKIIKEIAEDVFNMISGDFVFTEWKNQYGLVERTTKDKTYQLFFTLAVTFEESIRNIIANDNRKYLHEILIWEFSVMCLVNYINTKAKKRYRIGIIKEHEEIKKIDPTYVIPKADSVKIGTKDEGCYVATAVCGSYDCPQVWTLRRYRDIKLSSTWQGRLFIKTYYAVSPTIVKWFGETEWFNRMWKGKLDRMVERLQAEGYESTPYEDRKW